MTPIMHVKGLRRRSGSAFLLPKLAGACFITGLILAFATCLVAASTATLKGTVRAVAVGGGTTQSSAIAGARLTLINKAAPGQPLRTVSNALGDFVFDNLPSGDYTLTIEANGLAKAAKDVTLAPGALLVIDIQLSATVSESVTVRDEEGLVSASDVTTSNIVRGETMKTQPLRTDSFQNSIPLTPGAVRDGNGNDYLKGTRTGQSGYTVNGADVTDPATGNLAFDIPLEAASSVQIEENPYSANFGRFTGGVTNLQTKGGGDKFKISAARFSPTFHNIFTTKIDSFRPRVTLGGPIFPKKLFFLQSFEYRFSRVYVPSQPKPDNTTVQEGINSFTQIDWNINKENAFKFNAAIFPNKVRNFGLDTFDPTSATPNYKQRGILISASEQSIFRKASFLSSEISYKTFGVDVFAKGSQPFNVTPAMNTGSYFADTRRRSARLQWQETLYARPVNLLGSHAVRTGFELYHTGVRGQLHYNSIFIRRVDNTLAQRVDFTDSTPLDYKYNDSAFFAQDRWIVNPKLTLDYGLRLDSDGVTHRSNLAPRFSLLFQPSKNARTTVRAGAGVFFDRTIASVGYLNPEAEDGRYPLAEFDQVPERIVTNYASDGVTVVDGPRFFDIRVREPLRTPRSVRWSVQLDRQITKQLTGRVGYLQRSTKYDLMIDEAIGSGTTGTHFLTSSGRSRYAEMQALMAYNGGRLGQWNGFYVFSRSRGDLNSADKIFSDTPTFALRPNEYGRLPFDAPHRFMFYGQIDISTKHSLRLAPIFEVRSGFPFSKVNERLDFVGPRNEAGRFPMYLSLDLQVTKGIKLPLFTDKRARIGIVIFNSTNHFNPRDVQMNMTSPNYGRFYNSLGASIKGKFDLDF